MTVYSFGDSSGAFNHPLAKSYLFAGQIGVGAFVIAMATDHTDHKTAADGAVMVSAVLGDSGHITIEAQQTSSIHQFLLGWLNLCITAVRNGDVSNFATATISIRNITTGLYHTATGVSPNKMGDVPYRAQGENVTWVLPCANIVNG